MLDCIDQYSVEQLNLNVTTDQPYIAYYASSMESGDTDERSKAVRHSDAIVTVGDWEQVIIDDVEEALKKPSLNSKH